MEQSGDGTSPDGTRHATVDDFRGTTASGQLADDDVQRWGLWAMLRAPIDAIADLSEPRGRGIACNN